MAIRIPNTTLLDVSGRPVAINHQDFHHTSFLSHHDQNGSTNQLETTSKSSNATNFALKQENAHRLAVIGETPLHIAIVYKDLDSVKLLVKHGVDVNKRVLGDYNGHAHSRHRNETKKGRRTQSSTIFRRNETNRKDFNPQNSNPESNEKIFLLNLRKFLFFSYFLLV